MKTWRRHPKEVRCGRCGEAIYAGQPILEIQLPKLHRPLHRCVECEGPAPPDLPPLVDDSPLTSPPAPSVRGGVPASSPQWLPYRDPEDVL